jgi:hypothetical protein
VDPPAQGVADRDATLAILLRVRDEIRDWLKNEFLPRASAEPSSLPPTKFAYGFAQTFS